MTENSKGDSFDDPFELIRNNFNFAFVCEFLHYFSNAFFNGSDDILPTTPFMEHLLLYQDDAKKINQFYIKLLKPLPGWRLVSPENWFESLAKEYKKRDLHVDFPVPSTMSTILTIPLTQRLEILRNLCEFHLEQPEHFWELLKVNDGESNWRIEPVGKDSLNRRYWLFSDGRLYREKEGKSSRPANKKKDEQILWDIKDEFNWELICLSRSDYDEFLESFSANFSKNPKDKQFLKILKEEIIPKVEPILQFQLAQHRKYFRPAASEKICLLPRKRSSRLVQKELEEEQRRLEREESEREAEKARRALLTEKSQSLHSEPEKEKDFTVEREMRAEMRRMKKEKELQIKAIEEAFYSNYNMDESEDSDHDVEIVSSNEPAIIPSSPIKLVLKFSKPSETINEEHVDIVNEAEAEYIDIQTEPENIAIPDPFPVHSDLVNVDHVESFNIQIEDQSLIGENIDTPVIENNQK